LGQCAHQARPTLPSQEWADGYDWLLAFVVLGFLCVFKEIERSDKKQRGTKTQIIQSGKG
jgi:hypothetical protein